MIVDALPIGFVVEPLTLVDITICMIQGTIAIRFVVKPEADIFRSIRPLLSAFAVSHSVSPFTGVNCATGKCHWGLSDPSLTGVFKEISGAASAEVVRICTTEHRVVLGVRRPVVLALTVICMATSIIIFVLPLLWGSCGHLFLSSEIRGCQVLIDLESLLHLVSVNLLDGILVRASDCPRFTLTTLKDACTVTHD